MTAGSADALEDKGKGHTAQDIAAKPLLYLGEKAEADLGYHQRQAYENRYSISNSRSV